MDQPSGKMTFVSSWIGIIGLFVASSWGIVGSCHADTSQISLSKNTGQGWWGALK
jgi:hypothetical protein